MTIQLHCSCCLSSIVFPIEKELSSFKREMIAFTGDNALAETLTPVVTKCEHAFHESCLKKWIETFRYKYRCATCPACRANIVPPNPLARFRLQFVFEIASRIIASLTGFLCRARLLFR
jgi:hypothetical protein